MFNFSSFLDLSLIWGGIIAAAIFLYVLLDGFDLGVGILFPFASTDNCRHKMMNSVAPFWDGNETWLVLGGGSLLAAFPLAYAILLPAFYIPIMKTDHTTQEWTRKVTRYVLIYVALFIGLVSLWVPFLNDEIFKRWLSMPNLAYLSPIPVLTVGVLIGLYVSLMKKKERAPFFLSLSLFSLGYLGLAVSLWPWIVPYKVSLYQAAADPKSLSLMLVAVSLFLPFVLGYTFYSYYVFRGKSSHEEWY